MLSIKNGLKNTMLTRTSSKMACTPAKSFQRQGFMEKFAGDCKSHKDSLRTYFFVQRDAYNVSFIAACREFSIRNGRFCLRDRIARQTCSWLRSSGESMSLDCAAKCLQYSCAPRTRLARTIGKRRNTLDSSMNKNPT